MSAVAHLRAHSTPQEGPSAARAALRNAIEAREAAQLALGYANEAVERGNELLRGAEEMTAEYADAETRIVEHRAQLMISYATQTPSPDQISVPQELLHDRARKIEADERVEAARFASDMLTRKRNTAQSVLTEAKAQVLRAAAEVIREEAEEIADGLRVLEEQALARRCDLEGLSRIWIAATDGSGRPGPIALSARLVDLLNAPPLNASPPDGPMFSDPIAADAGRWRLYFERLQNDPEATL